MRLTTEKLEELRERAEMSLDSHGTSAGWYMNADIKAMVDELLEQRKETHQFDPESGSFIL